MACLTTLRTLLLGPDWDQSPENVNLVLSSLFRLFPFLPKAMHFLGSVRDQVALQMLIPTEVALYIPLSQSLSFSISQSLSV